jgi:eukaryotic-like serine/threonine-protein kinase
VIDITELRAQFHYLSNITPFGGGGQKEVCQAQLNNKKVALKLILPVPGSEERTLREIRAMRQLSSPFVPQVIESGECTLCGQKRQYVIENFVEGHTYRELLQKRPVQDFQQVLELTKVLISAAADFEKINLVHRDIKPENIMIDRIGKIWILDFGIARHLNLSSLTPTGGFGVGTIGYAPPEQYRNLKPEIDGRADLFAIGVVIHESLTGSHFYLRGAPDILAVIHKMDKLDLPRLALAEDPSNEFADFIVSLCQRFPSRRPRSAAEAAVWYDPIYRRLRSIAP